jgi:hypothetical protein
MKPDLLVLGLLPLSGGILWLFCTKWIKETYLRFYQKYEPRVWGVDLETLRVVRIAQSIPLWAMRILGAILILIGISILNTAVNSH